eukprot:3024965-Rhodomonas_salina.1
MGQAMYDFHRKDNVVIQVDLIRLQLPPNGISLSAVQASTLASQNPLAGPACTTASVGMMSSDTFALVFCWALLSDAL